MFGRKNKQPELKMKEFTLTDDELSELSFVKQQERAYQEVATYWGQRFVKRLETIKARLGLGADDQFDFRKLWSEGKLLSFHLPKPKINPEESVPAQSKHAEPELQKK